MEGVQLKSNQMRYCYCHSSGMHKILQQAEVELSKPLRLVKV